jgi:hypothetical protein
MGSTSDVLMVGHRMTSFISAGCVEVFGDF